VRKFSLGPEPQFATIVLLVCGPVLFGLALIVFESIRGVPAALLGIATHPADYTGYLIAASAWVQIFVLSLPATDDAEEEVPAKRYATETIWGAAMGMLIAIDIARKDVGGAASLNLNLAAYAAMALAAVHLVFVWYKSRHGRTSPLPANA
jgi:hypothetical protein